MNSKKPITIFIVTGRTGHSLIVSKALPFAVLEQVKTIYIFSESKGYEIPKCKYITIPNWIRRTKPVIFGKLFRFLYEPFQLLYHSLILKPDFINGVYCLPKGLNSYLVSRLSGVKCVNSVIGSILEIETELPFNLLWKTINLWHLKGCEAVTIKGTLDKQYLISKHIEPGKLFQLNGGVDLNRYFFHEGDRKIDLLFVGSFIELKGTYRIINIVQRILVSIPDINVVMVGEGELLSHTQKLALDLGIGKNISFAGFQYNTVPYFQRSKILLMPSRSESLPTAMLEAMACGCVPVISGVGNVREAALNDINAKVIDQYSDIKSFELAIIDLLKNEDKRRQYAINGRKTVEDFYSVKKQAEIAEALIKYLDIN